MLTGRILSSISERQVPDGTEINDYCIRLIQEEVMKININNHLKLNDNLPLTFFHQAVRISDL